MRAVIVGTVVGALLFFALLVAFASGTGTLELLLWLALALLSGVLAAKLSRSSSLP